MDRIDIHLEVKRAPFQKPAAPRGRPEASEPSATFRQRVEAARQVKAVRFAKVNKPNVLVNGDMGPAEVQSFCDLDEAAPKGRAAAQHGANLMRAAMQQMNPSARAYHRVLKLAAIADLAGERTLFTHFLSLHPRHSAE
jgi:magnesium chelatase family protein